MSKSIVDANPKPIIVEVALEPESWHGIYGVAKGDRLFVTERLLVLGVIAAEKATGFHFSDDGTTTAIVAAMDMQTRPKNEIYKYGARLEDAIREHELQTIGRALSESCGILDSNLAAEFLTNQIDRVVNNN